MSCCTKTKYNLFLKLTRDQKSDSEFTSRLKANLSKALDYSNEQSHQVVTWAINNETFLIAKDNLAVLTELSQKLALNSVPHELKLSK